MKKFVHETQRGFIDEECENLAREGLRTLVITQKYISKRDYCQWKSLYDRACELLDKRDEEVTKAVSYLEQDMEFLGITGVEDKLQDVIRFLTA